MPRPSFDREALRTLWRVTFRSPPPSVVTKDLMARFLCWHIQEQAFGGLDPETAKHLGGLARSDKPGATRPRRLKPGTVLLREYQGERHTVTAVPNGYVWRETTYASLSTIARAITGTAWSGPRFFGLRTGGEPAISSVVAEVSSAAPKGRPLVRAGGIKSHPAAAVRRPGGGNTPPAMTPLGDGERRTEPFVPKLQQCAIYTRKSTEHG